VILISTFHLGHSLLRHRSLLAFPVQIRITFLGLTLLGLWGEARVFVFAILLVGTFMVAAMGRCGISLILKPMPWNREREVQID
jgi:uncharacterized protein (DUF2062 family)